MSLERRYRLLLRAYPRSYQDRRGDEIVGTLLDAAPADRRRPTRADTGDLLAGAVRERFGVNAVPGFADGLRLAGPVGLVLAAAGAAGLWLDGLRTAGTATVAVLWLLAVLLRAVWPGSSAVAAAVAWLVTVAVDAANTGPHAELLRGLGATFGPGGSNPVLVVDAGQLYAGVLVAGLLAVAGITGRPGAVQRTLVPASSIVLVVAESLMDRPAPGLPQPFWYAGTWVLPVAAAVAGAGWFVLRHDSRGLWAALLLLVPLPVLMNPPGLLPWETPLDSMRFLLGQAYPLVAITACLVVTAVYVAAAGNSGAPATAPRRRLAAAGNVALAAAAVASTVEWFGAQAGGSRWQYGAAVIASAVILAGVALGRRWLPGWLARVLIAAGIVATLAAAQDPTNDGPGPVYIAAVTLLAVVALTTIQGRGGTAGLALFLFAAVAGAGLAVERFDVPYPDSWRLIGSSLSWDSATGAAFCAAMLLPVLVCAVRVVIRGGAGWAPALVAVAAALVWWQVILGPSGDSRVIVASTLAAAALLVGLRWVARRPTVTGAVG